MAYLKTLDKNHFTNTQMYRRIKNDLPVSCRPLIADESNFRLEPGSQIKRDPDPALTSISKNNWCKCRVWISS